MSACNFTQPIDGTECIGDSLYNKINPNFENLDNAVCSLSTNLLATQNSPTVNLTFNSATRTLSADTATYFSYRNKVINGDMRVNQRGFSGSTIGNPATVSTNNRFTFGVDRFFSFFANNNGMTTQTFPGTDGTNPEFENYMRVSVFAGNNFSNTGSPILAEQFNVQHRIEGYNMTNLKWGTANAKSATLTFWVRCSHTGTFGLSFSSKAAAHVGYPSQARVYFTTYQINVANTWEKKTITIPGDSTILSPSKWFYDQTIGVNISWNLGIGNFAFTPGGFGSNTWFTQTGGLNSTIQSTLQTLHNKTNSYFDLTGVQFEEGPKATPFEYRPYGTELTLCQRYVEFCCSLDSRDGFFGDGSNFYTNELNVPFKTTKRWNPSLTVTYAEGRNASGVANPGATAYSSSGVDWLFPAGTNRHIAYFSWRPISPGIDTAPFVFFIADSELYSDV